MKVISPALSDRKQCSSRAKAGTISGSRNIFEEIDKIKRKENCSSNFVMKEG